MCALVTGVQTCALPIYMNKLGLPTDIPPAPLCTAKKGDRKAKERQDPLPKECSACNFLKPPKTKECPICHHVAEAHSSLEEEDGELVQIDGKELEVTKDEKQRWLSGLYWIAAQRGYKQGWAANQYRERFGVWPKGLSQIPTKPDIDVEAFVKSRLIRFAKRKAA